MKCTSHFWIVFFMLVCLPIFCSCTAVIQQLSEAEPHCPEKCSCSSHLRRVDCIGKRLRSIPDDIPVSVTGLYLSHNFLTDIDRGAFQKLAQLKKLDLEYNLIERIADGAFLGLNNLTELYLRANKLSALSPEVFLDLNGLLKIYLGQNQLETVPDMRYAQNLTRIILDTNELKSARIPDGFSNLTQLRTLQLSNNQNLAKIADGDFAALNHSTIRKIDVSRCNLKYIGKNEFNFSRLQSLVLSYNTGWNVTVLRGVLSLLVNCSGLTSLDLSGVISLGTLPADIFKSLANVPLRHLNLAHTAKVSVIDNNTFQYIPTLDSLDMSNSEFSVIKDDMSALKNLTFLKLAGNKLLNYVPTLNLPKLKTMDLSSCKSIQDLEKHPFLKLEKLTKLIMRDCGIHRIHEDAFLGLEQLLTLDLSRNIVGSKSLPVKLFDTLGLLTKLDLSGNQLKEISTESHLFKKLQTLLVLDMSDNQCSILPEDIFKPLSSLASLILSGNSLGGNVISDVNGGKLFQGLGALNNVTLTGNNIRGLPIGLFDNLHSLEMVNLSHNLLTGWNGSAFNTSANLSLVDFTWNKITTVSEYSIVPLASQVKLNLSGNPFACWCDLIWFRNWITANNITDRRLPGLSTYRCSSPEAMYDKLLLDFDPQAIAQKCTPPPWIIITASVASGVAMVILFIVVLCYRYRWPIRLKVYKIRKRMRGERGYERLDEAMEYDYDVYVSYGPGDTDDDWVTGTLIPMIDARERERREQLHQDALDIDGGNPATAPFRVVSAYWETRDMLPGMSEIGAIAEAIHGSRKVLLVVSTDYLRDGRREFEIHLAVDKSCRAGRQLEDIMVVLLDHAAGVKLPAALHPKLNEALEWPPSDGNGQQLFWQKLQDFLHSDIDQPLLVNV